MYRVMFEDANGVRNDVAICDTMEGAWRAFSDYLKDMNVKVYYYRSWMNERNELKIDYGSHSCFGVIIQMFDFS